MHQIREIRIAQGVTPRERALPGLEIDLAFERAVFRHPRLSIYRRNATTWEALLILAAADEGEGPGLYEIVEAVQTRALGPSALLRFLRERRDEGSVLFHRNPRKQSKWCLSLRADLRRELLALIRARNDGADVRPGAVTVLPQSP